MFLKEPSPEEDGESNGEKWGLTGKMWHRSSSIQGRGCADHGLDYSVVYLGHRGSYHKTAVTQSVTWLSWLQLLPANCGVSSTYPLLQLPFRDRKACSHCAISLEVCSTHVHWGLGSMSQIPGIPQTGKLLASGDLALDPLDHKVLPPGKTLTGWPLSLLSPSSWPQTNTGKEGESTSEMHMMCWAYLFIGTIFPILHIINPWVINIPHGPCFRFILNFRG